MLPINEAKVLIKHVNKEPVVSQLPPEKIEPAQDSDNRSLLLPMYKRREVKTSQTNLSFSREERKKRSRL